MEPHVETPAEEKQIYEFFLISVLLKGAISVAEVIVGIIILIIPVSLFLSLLTMLIDATAPFPFIHEHLVEEAGAYGAGTAVFLAVYLLSRGLIKSVLIGALLKNWLWAYPASLIVLSLFLVYQFYQIATQGSLAVIAITIFDIVVMYFIWREWRVVVHHKLNK
ncbi:MAG: hypothetical protein AB202_01905 [Parcubacteria bacterium C7867-007]|nr:MAG: hypothetical protein AB202_01905 [Parcubacteria bacterium C7867-007]